MDHRCPLSRLHLPTEPCPEGKKAVDAARRGEEGGCPWFVASSAHCFCFFKFMADDGLPLETSQVATLLMMDDTEVKTIVQETRSVLAANDVGVSSSD